MISKCQFKLLSSHDIWFNDIVVKYLGILIKLTYKCNDNYQFIDENKISIT
jgi:hypothetical protein